MQHRTRTGRRLRRRDGAAVDAYGYGRSFEIASGEAAETLHGRAGTAETGAGLHTMRIRRAFDRGGGRASGQRSPLRVPGETRLMAGAAAGCGVIPLCAQRNHRHRGANIRQVVAAYPYLMIGGKQ